jgi:PAS domain S-box-containing protein
MPHERRTRDLFRLLVEAVKEYAIYMLDPNGVVTTWNPGAERIKGYSEAEIVGQHFSRFFPPEDLANGKPERVLRLAAELGSLEEEGWRVRKDGTRFWAMALVTSVRDADGKITGYAKVTRDLTERRRGDEARRQLEVARDAVRQRDDFLAIVAHEFRTPLTSLQIEVQAALRSSSPDAPPSSVPVPERLRRLQRHVARLDELVTGLVTVGRIASGQLQLDRAHFDLADLLRELVERWRPIAERQKCELSVQLDCPMPGEWDRHQLSEAIWAVLGNAVKYGAGAPVRVTASCDDQRASIQIVDQGPGIDMGDQARVFERFERAVPVANYGGFGVGLWVARQIIAAHGGDIEIHSVPGAGASFTLRLPLGAKRS